jgi:hypothetical protein
MGRKPEKKAFRALRSSLLSIRWWKVVGAELENDGDQFFEEVHFVEEGVSAEGVGEGEGVFVIGGGNGEQTGRRLEMVS